MWFQSLYLSLSIISSLVHNTKFIFTIMAYTKKPAETVSVEAKITELFINGLKQGIVGWQKPWVIAAVGNVAYDSVYTGYNKFWASLHAQMYNVRNHYATVAGAATKLNYKLVGKVWQDSKGNQIAFPIKKGAKGLQLVRLIQIPLKDKDGNLVLDSNGKQKTFPTMKGFMVFSVDHLVWDLEKFVPKENDNPLLDSGESILAGYKNCPTISISDKACYSPTYNSLHMPAMNSFKNSEAYYHTLFHELIHSTGHSDKLNRVGVSNFDSFGSHQYSFEELVAEIGSGMLCELAGIQMDIQNSIAYLNGWISKLQSEPKWIVKAAAEAKKAVELIIGRSITPKASEEVEEVEELEA